MDLRVAEEMFAAGATLEEAGRRFGVTRERVRQVAGHIAKKYRLARRAARPKKVPMRRRLYFPLLCKEDECLRRAAYRGWCQKHYQKWLYHHSPERRRKVAAAIAKWRRAALADPVKGPRLRKMQAAATRRWARRKAANTKSI